jgi:ABC-type multidrug transport system ATPase subunit
MFSDKMLYNRLTGYDNLKYFAKLYQITDYSRRIQELGELLDLSEWLNELVEQYSLGMHTKLAIARTLIHDPEILLLDEPTANLDPNSATIIENAIMNRTREKGIIIILATHNLNQAKRLANEVVHIYNGKIVEVAGPEEFFTNPRSEISRKFIKGELEY